MASNSGRTTLPAPWRVINDASTRDRLTRELATETPPSHVLHGLRASALARRADSDDVLFEVLDGTGRVAVVHLTWARAMESDTRWPDTIVYQSLAHFLSERTGGLDVP